MTRDRRFSIRPSQSFARLSAEATANASVALGTLSPGVRVVGLNKGQFSLIDMLRAVLIQVGPADVLVSTWTPGKFEMNCVADMLDAHQITRFRLLVDRSFVTRHPEYVGTIQAMFGAETIRQTRTHAKFALVAAGDYRIAIRTSMNFNRNARFEQFDMDDDAAIYNFFDGAANELYDSVPAGLDVDSSVIHRTFYGDLFRGLADEAQPDGNEYMEELDFNFDFSATVF